MIYILIFIAGMGHGGSVSFEKFNTKEACEAVGEAASKNNSGWFSTSKFECIAIKD